MESLKFQKSLEYIEGNLHRLAIRNYKQNYNDLTQKAGNLFTAMTGSDCCGLAKCAWKRAGRFRRTSRKNGEFQQQYRPLIIALDLNRAELYERINARVENMFRDGLLKEVEFLRQKGYQATDPGLQAIGYKEIIEAASHYQPAELLAKIQKNSRNYAKRQLCFLRQIPQHYTFHPENAAEIARCIANFINAP